MILAAIAGLLLFGTPVPHLGISMHKPSASPRDARHMTVRRIHACGVLRSPNTTYVLVRNVKAAGTCFALEADNITLNLNRHTITYGTRKQKHPVYGVLAADCWFKVIAGNPCRDGHHTHIEIMNGKIVEGQEAPPMSHAIRMGQGNDFTGVNIHGLDITISEEDTIGIYAEYLPGGSDIYKNTIHNNVKVISNRMQFRGASIKLDGESSAKIPDQIHDNVIIGGPQLGIRDDNSAGTRIYNNDISQDATYTNGFCIDAAGDNMLVYHNYCHPVHGRGIHANHSGVQIFDNTVETVDSNQNLEYKGCEIHGTYGIQVESDTYNPTDVRVYDNHVIVHAAQCGADAMRLTDLKGAEVRVYDNTFIAVQDKINGTYTTRHAYGLSIGDVIGTHVRFYNNVVRADTAIFYIDWDSGSDITLADNAFQAGRLGDSTLLADIENGAAPAHDNYFLDNTYQGVSPSSARFGPYSGDSWYGVLDTLHIHAVGAGDKPPRGLVATAIDSQDSQPHEGLDYGKGDIEFILPVLRIGNKMPPKSYTPYRINLDAPGCNRITFEVPAPIKAPIQQQLRCSTSAH